MTGLMPAIDSYTLSKLNVVTFSFMSCEIMFNSCECIGVNGKDLQLCAVYKCRIFYYKSHENLFHARTHIRYCMSHALVLMCSEIDSTVHTIKRIT